MGRLEGKVAVVTGANSGIGLAIAQRFAKEGARLFITGRREAELDSAVKQIGGDTIAVQGDVSKLADIDRLYRVVSERAGRLDIVAANAGIGEFVPLDRVTEEHYERLFAINVKGALFTVQKALPLLRDGGSIVMTGSNAADKGTPAFSVYAGTKGAIRSFVRGWALELGPRRIRANVLMVGPVTTPGWSNLVQSPEQLQQVQDMAAVGSPLHRMGRPDEVADAALFLASDESSYLTGGALYVDGGTAQV
ncbi:SDR family NAD(P)-dependent oxidoreductase [Burkholderia gladioli]|uniref:SDR family NAD(P)-dependent oxidoreductase n=1 Tax=Burkholderia gladioli TaxID=28095 RepID=UPI00164038F6|nr:glucose 1-dehydrogenase [Burkholderia gladioli]